MPVKLNTDAVDLRRLAETNHRWKQQLGLPNLPIRIQIIDENEFTLRAEAVTGIVRVGHTDIEIAPKFLDGKSDNWQSVLWKILSVVEGGYVDSNETATEELSSLSMPDLLAEMFLASYSKGASRGLPRSYSALHSSGQTLRGKFDIQRIGVWLAKPWDLPYVADTLTENTPLARLLRWTAAQLSKTVKSPHRARAIHEIAESLSFVDKLPPHLVDAKKIFLDPQYKNLEAAKTVGILLLEGSGLHHARGDHNLSGFLWDSDLIYEKYVYWLFKQVASELNIKISKKTIKFGEVVYGKGSILETVPDIILEARDGKPIAIIDSKYKRMGLRPKSQDTYQIITGAHILGCNQASLVYPASKNKDSITWKITSALGGSDIELTALPLNLMSLCSPRSHNELLQMLRSWLFKIL